MRTHQQWYHTCTPFRCHERVWRGNRCVFRGHQTAKEVFAKLVAGDASMPSDIVSRDGLSQISDVAVVRQWALAVVADPANASAVANYRAGNKRLLGPLVAKVLAASGGRANPTVVNAAVVEAIEQPSGPA